MSNAQKVEHTPGPWVEEIHARDKETHTPCVVCGKDSSFTVGWLAPTRYDSAEETCDTRPACSFVCAFKAQRKG